MPSETWWYYENRRNVSGRDATIHNGACKNCNDGVGQRGSDNPTQQARWKGPFSSDQEAINAARGAGRTIILKCSDCCA